MIKRRLISFFLKRRLSELRRFQNIHNGQACYIFGDGPSIKWVDFARFADKPAICCGMIPFHKDFHLLDVRYCSLVEPWLFCPDWLKKETYLKELNPMVGKYREVIRSNSDKSFFVNISNMFSLSGNNIVYVGDKLYEEGKTIDPDLSKFHLFGGSFHASLALAYHLGFKTVHMVGFDAWTLQPAKNKRWYEKGQGEEFTPTNFAYDYLNILKRHMDIYTIGFGGISKNIKSIDYEDFTGGIKPMYRENTELMEVDYLDALAKCKEYTIY